MQREGQGHVKPKPATVFLLPNQVDRLYEAAGEIGDFRRYNQRHDIWGKGLIATPLFAGLLGEQAMCNWLRERLGLRLVVDISLQKNGDGGKDIRIPEARQALQIKNRRGGEDLLIRREAASSGGAMGKIVPFESDVFVKVSCPAIGSNDPCRATIDGWVRDKSLFYSRFCDARRGDHKNIEVPDERLLPPEELIDFLKTLIEEHRR